MISLMEIEGEGYYGDREEIKPNFYQRVSALKQRELSRGMDFAKVEMNKQIRKAQECLKKINTIETRSKIEMEKYGNTSTSIGIERNKLLAAFNFYVTVIGYIDSKIKDERNKIEFNSHFLPVDDACNDRGHYDEIDASKEKIARYMIDREEILDDFESHVGQNEDVKKIIDAVLRDAPSYLNFGKLFENCEEDFHQIELQAYFMNAYNIGLLTKDYYGTSNDYESRVNRYRRLLSDLTVHVHNNKSEFENVKVLKK